MGWRKQSRLRRVFAAAIVFVFAGVIGVGHAARAGEGEAVAPRLELFSGTGATSNSIFAYFGSAWAFGRDVRGEGPRVKVLAGAGGYDYHTTLPGSTFQSRIGGDVSLFQALAGYQWRRGEWTLKGYGGVT